MSINGKQSVKLEKGIIEFENYFKQIPVSFKIYADFECNLKNVKCNEGSYTEKHQDHIPCSFAYKVARIDNRFTKPTIIYRVKNAAYEFIKTIFKEHEYCKNIIEEHFNKILLWKKNYFKKNLLIMMKKKLEIIFTQLVNLEVLLIEIVM